MNTLCLPSYEQCIDLPVKNDMTNAQSSVCTENDALREHRIVDDCEQEENESVRICDWEKVISELYGRRRERHAKLIVALPYKENFGQIRIPETVKDLSACIRFLYETGNECLLKSGL